MKTHFEVHDSIQTNKIQLMVTISIYTTSCVPSAREIYIQSGHSHEGNQTYYMYICFGHRLPRDSPIRIIHWCRLKWLIMNTIGVRIGREVDVFFT